MPDDDVLEVRHVVVRFGSVAVLTDVTCRVGPSECVGIIGPNGAGKSTLLDVVSGFVRPQAGEVRLFGRVASEVSPVKRARGGLGRTFQTPVIFEGLTVEESMDVTFRDRSRRASERRKEVKEALYLTGLAAATHIRVERLTNYERRVAEVARCLLLRPRLLLLDEPASGLRAPEIASLSDLIVRLRDDLQISALVVSHDMSLVHSCCSSIMVIKEGQVLMTGEPQVVLRDAKVVEAYFGTDVDALG